MPLFVDHTEKRFGRWTVIKRAITESKSTYWVCKCDCGTIRNVSVQHMVSGKTRSCGCFAREKSSRDMKGNKFGLIHGLHAHPLRSVWKAMKHRCYNKNNECFNSYGNRGISVCEEWKASFLDFYDWALESGWKKGLSIDRIDNDGNYEPPNCRWITISANSKRRKSNHNPL